MSILTIVRRNIDKAAKKLRAAAINRLEQDIDWANASHDAHVRGLERQLERLLEKDTRSAQDVARDACRREKGLA